MKRLGVFTLVFMSVISLFADHKVEDIFEFSHNKVAFSGLVTSSDTYQLEVSYHYMFNRYIGLGGSLGFWKVWYEDGRASEKDWEIESDDNKPSNFYLHPSLVLKTPAIRLNQVDMGLYTEPGVMLNIPYTGVNIQQYTGTGIHQTSPWPYYDYKHISTSKGQWFAVDIRVGLFVNFGPLGFSAGYTMSNYDVYSQYRHLSYKGNSFSKYYPKKSFMQGAYLTASYYF